MIKIFLLDIGGKTRTTAAWQKMWRLHADDEPCLHNRIDHQHGCYLAENYTPSKRQSCNTRA